MIAKPADLALLPQIAPKLATVGSALCGPNCKAYHRAWGYLRLYGALPAVGRDHAVMLEGLRAEFKRGARDVLISGSADAGILAYVIAAMQAERITGRVAVIDLCPTPLAICTWYGAQVGMPVETWCGYAQDYAGTGFDLVVSHNFLQSIPPPERPAVTRAWHNALRVGGRAFAIANIRPSEPQTGRRFDPDKVALLLKDLEAGRQSSPNKDLISKEDLHALARAYAEARVSHRLRSEAELTDPIEAAGLRVTSFDNVAASLNGSEAAAHKIAHRKRLIAERVR